MACNNNNKDDVATAVSRCGTTVSGYLAIEEVENSNNFILCFFVLEKAIQKLTYYKDRPGTEPDSTPNLLGFLNLQMVSNISYAKEMRPQLNHCIVLHSPGKKVFLSAATQEVLDIWMKELKTACQINVPKDNEAKDLHGMSDSEPTAASKLLTRTPGHAWNKSISSGHNQADPDSSGEELEDYVHKEAKVIKKGYCVKLGAVVKNWKRRWFTLDEYGITYYKNELAWNDRKMPLGKIDIQDVQEVKESSGVHPNRDNLFEIKTNNRVFYIQTDTPPDMKSWLSTIESVVKISKQQDKKKTTWL